MKNISLFHKTVTAILIAAIVFATSCKKQEAPVKMPETTQAQTIDKVPWIPIIGGIVYVLVHVTEGRYYKEVTYNPDGSVASIKEGCKGLGSCSVRGEKQNASGGFTSISSVVYGDDYDYSGEAQLIKTKDGKILLKMSNEPNNEACYQNFFYDNIIEISRPWIIDDYEVLDKLERLYDNAITVQGKYEVFTLEDGKYIIIG